MRRLLAIIAILTCVLSVVIGLWSLRAGTLTNCVAFLQGYNAVLYDIPSGRVAEVAYYGGDFYSKQWQQTATSRNGQYWLVLKHISSDRFKIFLAKSDGSSKFLMEASAVEQPTWSFDDRRVAFVSAEKGQSNSTYSVSVVDVVVGSQHTFQVPANSQTTVHWSADGQFLYSGYARRIHIFDPDLNAVFSIPIAVGVEVGWSNIGHQLVLIADANMAVRMSASQTNTLLPTSVEIMNVDGSQKKSYSIAVPNENTHLNIEAWSPDGRYLMITPSDYQIISAAEATITVIDTLNDIVWPVVGRRTGVWIDSHTLSVWRETKDQDILLSVDLETSKESILLASDHDDLLAFYDHPVFSINNKVGLKDLWAMNIDGSNRQLIAPNIDEWNRTRYVGNGVGLVARRGSQRLVSFLDLINHKVYPAWPVPGMSIGAVGFISQSDWLAINATQTDQPIGVLVNIKTGEIKNQGIGRFDEPNQVSFTSNSTVLFIQQLPDNRLEYRLFDTNGEVVARYRLPAEYQGFGKSESADHSHLFIQQITNGQLSQVWIAENFAETVKPIIQRNPKPGEWKEWMQWTPDAKRLMLLSHGGASLNTRIGQRASITIYDTEGIVLQESPISPDLLFSDVIETSTCNFLSKTEAGN